MTYDAHPDRSAKSRLPAQVVSPPSLFPEVPNEVLAEVAAAGLPPLGAIITGEGGLQFEVTGYWRREPDHWVERRLALERGPVEHPTEERFAIMPFEALSSEPMPGEDLFPFIRPINPSPRLLSMIEDVDLCSPKDLIFADLCSSAPGRMRYTWRNQIDHVTNPWSIDVMVDASSVDETVLAHELGHAFIDLILGIEDHRTYRDSSDRPACFQVSSVQSTILDITVNEVLKLRGFDLGTIAEHVCDTTYYYAQAIHSGFVPSNDYEASWIALGHAAALAVPELYEFTPDQEHRIAIASRVFSEVSPNIAELSLRLRDAIKDSGWRSSAKVQLAVDRCLIELMRFCGHRFSPMQDMVSIEPADNENDKSPDFFPDFPIWAKYEVRREFIRMGKPDGHFEVGFCQSTRRVVLRRVSNRSPSELRPALRRSSRNSKWFNCSVGESHRQTRNTSLGSDQPGGNQTRLLNTAPQGEKVRSSVPRPNGNLRYYLPGIGRLLARVRFSETVDSWDAASLLDEFGPVVNHPAAAYAPINPLRPIGVTSFTRAARPGSKSPNPQGFWDCINGMCNDNPQLGLKFSPLYCSICAKVYNVNVNCSGQYFDDYCKVTPPQPPVSIQWCPPEDLLTCRDACIAICRSNPNPKYTWGQKLCRITCRNICVGITSPICELLFQKCEKLYAAKNYTQFRICYAFYMSIDDCRNGNVGVLPRI